MDRIRASLKGISHNVYVLGVVSFFTDISSEMIVPVRMIFFVSVLATPLPLAGLIEGIAESTASLLKIVSGRIADRVSRRKPLILFGYGVSNTIKPFMSLVTTWPAALAIVFTDRVGKGVRGSPRDAMMADATEQRYMGKAFGFHRSMDTLGAAAGPLFTALILFLNNNELRSVFAWTAFPGLLAVLVIWLFLHEQPVGRKAARENKGEQAAAEVAEVAEVGSQPGSSSTESERDAQPLSQSAQPVAKAAPRGASLSRGFWVFTAISSLFALGNSSDAFLFLRTQNLEESLAAVPLIYFAYNIVYALLATPLGALSDRLGRMPVLLGGYAAFSIVYAGWAVANQAWNAWALFLLYGIYTAATEGVGKAFVVDLVPRELRGSALGWFTGLTGMAALPANVLSGWLWQTYGPGATFGYGAVLAGVSAVLLLLLRPRAATARVSSAA